MNGGYNTMSSIFSNIQMIDLSVTVSESNPSYWPGHMPFSAKTWNYFAPVDEAFAHVQSSAPYHTRYWIIDEHCGTHFDAPTHFIPPRDSGLPHANEWGTQTGEQVPLDNLFGDAVCIDVTTLAEEATIPGESPWIMPSHVEAWEGQNGTLNQGEIVLFCTGWDRHYTAGPEGRNYSYNPLVTKSTPGWPAPHRTTIAHLYEKGVRCVGIDAPSVGAAHDGAPAHYEGLSRGMRYVELLTGLGELPARGFAFMFLPVKVAGATGGPGRAVALLS